MRTESHQNQSIPQDVCRTALVLKELAARHCELIVRCGGTQDLAPREDHYSPTCRHQEKLRRILGEVIEELEATRRAFKSKQLEQLRKRLISVLAEEA